jgi:hypothetical protein
MADQYIVKICATSQFELNDYYFYKNGLLHREEGPAVLLGLNEDSFYKIKGRKLYKEEFIPYKFPPGYEIKYVNSRSPAIKPASYYLNNEPYTEEEFNNIKSKLALKNELNNELPCSQSNTNTKKNKI